MIAVSTSWNTLFVIFKTGENCLLTDQISRHLLAQILHSPQVKLCKQFSVCWSDVTMKNTILRARARCLTKNAGKVLAEEMKILFQKAMLKFQFKIYLWVFHSLTWINSIHKKWQHYLYSIQETSIFHFALKQSSTWSHTTLTRRPLESFLLLQAIELITQVLWLFEEPGKALQMSFSGFGRNPAASYSPLTQWGTGGSSQVCQHCSQSRSLCHTQVLTVLTRIKWVLACLEPEYRWTKMM